MSDGTVRIVRALAVLAGRAAGLVLLLASVPTIASTEPVNGRVVTRTTGQAAPAAAIVYAELLSGSGPIRPTNAVITQKKKTFLPRALGVPVGSTVSFPNEDAIFHNVFSLSGPQPFDLGLYRAGASKDLTFSKPGTYLVFCNIHPQMSAFLVVAPSQWTTNTAPDGRWSLDLPPGKYRVTTLSERSSPVIAEVQVGGTGTTTAIELTLDESTFAQVPHSNKFGKPYPKEAYKQP